MFRVLSAIGVYEWLKGIHGNTCTMISEPDRDVDAGIILFMCLASQAVGKMSCIISGGLYASPSLAARPTRFLSS